ncbi:lariat debranching enzyme, C-terminal domain-containing protein [Crepidotus variabilis]|uniref:Lariat debranching enzyme, C-terminal domain-containing protein n=1 Tax=Crepidotus variabilis TaxID=179855 RepID=A0A9P6JRH5_9AGAR|nr:lariat debranching enzyme, C-terminal domain-containing protein [Crepidotus variabilis]
MKLAVEGCCHGELDAIYTALSHLEARNQYKVDALLICGDFEAIRNHADLECMAVPNKYKHLQTFYKYYTGEKTAPVLTLVIGGNHEASNYFAELYHGGWLAPNIYYLGCAGSVLLNGARISGMSGIFNPRHFRLGHHERLPYDSDTMRSIYHIREYNVRRLSLLPPPRVFLSHDWPAQIEQHGDLGSLLRRKSFLRADIEKGALGSPPAMGLLRTLRPEWWCSAHLHVKFEGVVRHIEEPTETIAPPAIKNPDEIEIDDEDFDVPLAGTKPAANPDEIKIDDEEEDPVPTPLVPEPASEAEVPTPPPHPGFVKTKFLALDKCLPKRQFLEVIDIDVPSASSSSETSSSKPSSEEGIHSPPTISFDPSWLAITRAFAPFHSTTKHQPAFPSEEEARALIEKEEAWVKANIKVDERGYIPVNTVQVFAKTAPGPSEDGGKAGGRRQPPWFKNPQTEAFCRMLQIKNVVDLPA